MRDTFRLQREQICERVAWARRAAGLSQEGLAQNLSACSGSPVSVRQVRRYEKSRVPWALLDDLARLTGTTREWLLYGEGETRAAEAPSELREHSVRGWQLVEESAAGATHSPPSAGRVALGLVLGFLVGVAIQSATGSTPAAVVALTAIVMIAWLRRAPARR
jgi:transcriptional regulator with XRE-family HTH domain